MQTRFQTLSLKYGFSHIGQFVVIPEKEVIQSPFFGARYLGTRRYSLKGGVPKRTFTQVLERYTYLNVPSRTLFI